MTADSTSFNHIFDFFQQARIFSSLCVYNQILMQAADNKCFMEDESFYKLMHHNETLCILSSKCDCCEVKSIYIDNPIF